MLQSALHAANITTELPQNYRNIFMCLMSVLVRRIKQEIAVEGCRVMRSFSSSARQLILVCASFLCACSPSQSELLAQQQAAEKQLAQRQYEQQRQDYLQNLDRYTQWKTQQQQHCLELDYKQVELNRAYEQIRHDSPVTTNLVLETSKKLRNPNLTDDAKSAITDDVRSRCLILALGDGDCSKVSSDIHYAVEQQRLLNEQIQSVCCEVKTIEEAYSDVGMEEFKPQCTVPSAPQPPTPPGV